MAAVNGKLPSDSPSSASEDFYDTGASAQEVNNTEVADETQMPERTREPHATNGNDDMRDSSSEMDMSDTSSDSSSSAPETNGASHAGAKRKMQDAPSGQNGDAVGDAIGEPVKKRRTLGQLPASVNGLPTCAGWPAEFWQHTFLHLSPAMLSRCLRVSKAFNHYLTRTKANPGAKKNAHIGKEPARLHVLDSESIWVNSRKYAYPAMAKPIPGFTELQMLQLIGSQRCQSCGKPAVRPPATTVFNAGPGENGVRVIWPFHVRICGVCFQQDALRDVDLLGAASPVARLTNGLPHAFRSQDGHFVPDIVRQTSGIPGQLRIQKTFHKRDIQKILEDWEEVKAFGDGAAEEWRKGLVQRGKSAMADASRWERWEATMPLGTVLAEALREYDLASFPRYVEKQRMQSAHVNDLQHTAHMNGTHHQPQQIHQFNQMQAAPNAQPAAQTIQHVQRTVRNAQEVDAARQARRADIERRCMELNPPLEPNVLQHIKAFQNTMQITTPLTDSQWEGMLKPRILEEREAAELIEHQRMQQMAALQAAIPSMGIDETYTRPAKEVYDREYEQAQEPLRTKLGEYADDYINGHWHGGRALDRDSCALFAADVLLHVRARYVTDRELGILPTKFTPSTTPFTTKKSPGDAQEPFLSLDNMKHVYDTKIRAYTDHLRRELFVCAGCVDDNAWAKPKWFAFEGLIQHYGAKHTHTFSRGNVVVHWQTAEWPDEPPFVGDPSKWVKSERKVAAHKGGRVRGTPLGGKEVAGDGVGALLSENPLFSTPSTASVPQNGSYPYPPAASDPYAHSYAPAIDTSQESQVSHLSTSARQTWDKLDGIKDLLEPIRMQTVFHHVSATFAAYFGFAPNLDLLTDALATNVGMRPVKNAHGLACRLCVQAISGAEGMGEGGGGGAGAGGNYWQSIAKVRLYNASSLITHFKIAHAPHAPLSWEQDMLEVPEREVVRELERAVGMDDEKLALIAAAFPDVWGTEVPVIGTVTEEERRDIGPDSGLAGRLVKKFGKKGQQPPSKKKKGLVGGFHGVAGGREGSNESLPEPREDEYDPRRPMFTDKGKDEGGKEGRGDDEGGVDMSRFDTDLAKKDAAGGSGGGSGSGGTFDLAPETLTALNNLTALTAQQPQPPQPPQHMGREGERSPSVGRPDSRPSTTYAAPAPPPATGVGSGFGLPNGQPDISAILASLTGQSALSQAPATPTYPPLTAAGHRASQTPLQPYSPYTHPSPATHTPRGGYLPQEARRSSARYASVAPGPGSWRGSAEPNPLGYEAPGQDLRTAYSRNSASFVHNGLAFAPQTQHQGYAAEPPPPAQAVQPSHGYAPPPPPQQQSPPRYRIIYESDPSYPPPLQQRGGLQPYRPVEGEVAPVQYRYERHAPPPTQQRPGPVYLDEYGRPLELVPIDQGLPPGGGAWAGQTQPQAPGYRYGGQQYAPQGYAPQPQYETGGGYEQRPPYEQGQGHGYGYAAQQQPQGYGPPRQPVYYEQAPPPSTDGGQGGGQGGDVRYVYDGDDRGSVPRA